MTTIILTIIGILLAAAAALMVIFYGGDAFNSGTVGAQANQIQNGGTNVVSAIQMYKAERASAPTTFAQLTAAGPNGAYLDEQPALPDLHTPALVTVGTRQLYTVSGVPAAVCTRINTNLRVTAPTPVAPATMQETAAAAGSPKMFCADGTFYARA